MEGSYDSSNIINLGRLKDMRDFTTVEYCDFLWIFELINIPELESDNKRFCYSTVVNGTSIEVPISNVSIFATIVEVKMIKDKGTVYLVDDGTGVIACKYNPKHMYMEELLDVAENELNDLNNGDSTFYEQSDNNKTSSILDISEADDTIFNNRTTQFEEKEFCIENRKVALSSLWESIIGCFNEALKSYNLGDSVHINGKLYNYFGERQIYVNSIRHMSLTEKMTKMQVKVKEFENTHSYEMRESQSPGNMTFDNVNPAEFLETGSDIPQAELPSNKSKRITELDEDSYSKVKRKSIVPPNLETMMTFDTFSQSTQYLLKEDSDSDCTVMNSDDDGTALKIIPETDEDE